MTQQFTHHRPNDIISGLLHLIGFGLSVAALVLLIVFAQTGAQVTTVTIFGSGLLLLYFASSVYHLFPPHRARTKAMLRIFDHLMIYVLIAATYTPICVVVIGGAWGWSLFGVGWGLALLGIVMTAFPRLRPPVWFSVMHYLAMGWLVVFALPVVMQTISASLFFWLLLGGVCYTVGAICFGLSFIWKPRWFGWHEVFHLLVIAGSFCHFWFLLSYLRVA